MYETFQVQTILPLLLTVLLEWPFIPLSWFCISLILYLISILYPQVVLDGGVIVVCDEVNGGV